jgi:DNA-binding MarR family transcriptional regulator
MSLAAKSAAGAASRPVSKQRLRLWLRLLLARRAIEAELRERLRVQFEMTLPQFDVMAALARNDGGMTMTALSRALMVSNGNVTGIVERLVARRYVVQQASAKDRRRFIVRLTAKGAARFNDVAKAHEEWVDGLLSDFKSNEAEALLAKFENLTHAVSNEEQPNN